jgi:hypothetical protein
VWHGVKGFRNSPAVGFAFNRFNPPPRRIRPLRRSGSDQLYGGTASRILHFTDMSLTVPRANVELAQSQLSKPVRPSSEETLVYGVVSSQRSTVR